MITKTIETGIISILADGQLQIREDTVIREDEVEISRTYHRTVLVPSSDTSSITDPKVKSVAEVVWTPAVVEAYETSVARHTPPITGDE